MTREEALDLRHLVRKAIQRLVSKEKGISAEILLKAVLKGKTEPTGGDSEFFVALALYGLGDMIKREMLAFKEPTSTEALNRVLPGFEYLQAYYSVKRDDAVVWLPLNRLTHEEVEAKAREHECQAAGHVKHAEELRAWNAERDKQSKSIRTPILVR
jgi:hypothetical protein